MQMPNAGEIIELDMALIEKKAEYLRSKGWEVYGEQDPEGSEESVMWFRESEDGKVLVVPFFYAVDMEISKELN